MFGVRRWRTTRLPGRDDRGHRVRAASRGVPDRRVIPDGPDWKVLAENRVPTASPVRKARLVRKARAAKPAHKASPVRGAKPVRAAKPDRPANCLRSNR